jgi:uncharacterized protein YkwD
MAFRFRFGLAIVALFLFSGSTMTHNNLSIQQLLDNLNHDRLVHGLKALNIDPTLNLAALAKAEDMIQQNYFAHTSPSGTTPWHWFKSLGYEYTYAGENLAQGFQDPDELENALMASPSHRANILSPFYSQVGLAVATVNNTNVVVEFFGSQENKVTLRQ